MTVRAPSPSARVGAAPDPAAPVVPAVAGRGDCAGCAGRGDCAGCADSVGWSWVVHGAADRTRAAAGIGRRPARRPRPGRRCRGSAGTPVSRRLMRRAPPVSEATTALTLHAAWQPFQDGVDRSRRSTATACAFIDTSSVSVHRAPKHDGGRAQAREAPAQPDPDEHTAGIAARVGAGISRAAGRRRATSPPTNCMVDQRGGSEDGGHEAELGGAQVQVDLSEGRPDDVAGQPSGRWRKETPAVTAPTPPGIPARSGTDRAKRCLNLSSVISPRIGPWPAGSAGPVPTTKRTRWTFSTIRPPTNSAASRRAPLARQAAPGGTRRHDRHEPPPAPGGSARARSLLRPPPAGNTPG